MPSIELPFEGLDEVRVLLDDLPGPDNDTRKAAVAHNRMLTKPPDSLGRLDELAIWYASWRREVAPVIRTPQIVIFAANHGVALRGVSAFPVEVTGQMVANFQAGGAAINQLSSEAGAELDVHPLAIDRPTQDFTNGAAMTESEVAEAMSAGWHSVRHSADLLVVGEMGIGNTTSAAAMSLMLFGGTAGDWTGRGTGVDDETYALKKMVVESAVAANKEDCGDPLETLRCLGGREVAAMAGAILRARILKIPVILDGFISSAAAAVLHVQCANSLDHAVAGHLSAEAPHRELLRRIQKRPLLQLDMRLGEGSGATVAINILKSALACHSGMATFAQAGVSES